MSQLTWPTLSCESSLSECEIVLFRYRRSLRFGVVLGVDAKKIRLEIDKGKSVTVPRSNVLHATGESATSPSSLRSFAERTESMAEEIDLQEVWELLREEADAFGYRDLAELYWSDGATQDRYAAMLCHLEGGECTYFEAADGLYLPVGEEALQAAREREERRAAERDEEAVLLSWVQSGSGIDTFSSRQQSWLERCVDFVVHADESRHGAWVKKFIAGPYQGGNPRRWVFDRLVEREVFDLHENLDLRRAAVETEFSSPAIAAAAQYDPTSVNDERQDLRSTSVLSIDSASTIDIDDALSVERTSSGCRVGVHITDLSACILAESLLDGVARDRMVSFYFPEQRVPMLPPEISANSGSLIPGEERLSVTLFADFDQDNSLTHVELVPARIVNHHRLTYDEVDRVLEGEEHPLAAELALLDRVASACLQRRLAAGAVELQRPDLSIEVDAAGEVSVTTENRDTPANRIVTEFMIFYNEQVATFCTDRGLPIPYRYQGSSAELPSIGTEPNALECYQFFRQLPPSELALVGKPHRMLGVELYTQASSPLRRYFDLVVQRQLVSFLTTGEPLHSEDELRTLFLEGEGRLRKLGRLEMNRRRYWLQTYLAARLAEPLTACVLEDRGRDFLVELDSCGLRATARLIGAVRPGDSVTVEVAHVDPWSDTLRLHGVAE